MKTKSKALAISLCAILLVIASVMGTMAYLTSEDKVTNTFTVGKVAITLDEAKVNNDGEPVDKDGNVVSLDKAPRVDENSYKLMPGHEYTKDPTVHFAAGSEASYLFVKIENGINAIIDDKTIEAQIIKDNGWMLLDGYTGVYYKKVEANTTAVSVDYKVFDSFKIKGEVISGSKNDEGADKNKIYLNDYADATITVTAYAVQADGFTNAEDAWKNTFGKSTSGTEGN